MPTKRIYLGIDSHTNLAISLEPTFDGIFNISLSEGTGGRHVCNFAVAEEALEAVLQNKTFKVECNAGDLEITSWGDQIVFHFRRAGDKEISSCALGIRSFLKVMRVAHNRAYAS